MKLTIRMLALLLVLLFLFSGCSTVEDTTSESSSTTKVSLGNKKSWEAGVRGGVLLGAIEDFRKGYRNLAEYSDNKELHYPSDKQKYYNIIDENKKMPVAQLNYIEFIIMGDMVGMYNSHSRFGDLSKHIVLTAGDFNTIEPISGIKVLKDKGNKYAYNLYGYNGITICVMYRNLSGVLWYEEIFIFDKIQSYDELKNNVAMTYEEGKNTKKDLYEVDQYLAEISDEAFQYVAYVDRYTTHMTEKGFLIIGYKNKKPHQVKHSYLAKGIYKKLHQSLLLDMLLDSQFTG